MCYQIVERYAACHCHYFTHGVDRCVAYGHAGHQTVEKVVFVGYACPKHSQQGQGSASAVRHAGLPDSGYSSAGGYGQHNSSYRR
jgi:hypothetical protein